MTLVATYEHLGRIVFLSDMLLTRNPGPDAVHDLPSLPTVSDVAAHVPPSAGLSVDAMGQKLLVVNPRFALGWTGSFDRACELCRFLKDRFSNESPSIQDVRDALQMYVAQNHSDDELEILGALLSGEKRIRFYWDKTGSFEILGDDLACIGSGADLLSRLHDESGGGSKSSVADASYAIALAGTLLLAERVNGTTLRNAFGSGYQFIVEDEHGFRYVDSVTYLFAQVRRDKNGGQGFSHHAHVLKQGHTDERVWMARIETTKAKSLATQYFTRSLLGETSEARETDVFFRSEYYCCITTVFDGQVFAGANASAYHADLCPFVAFSVHEGVESIGIDVHAIMEQVRDIIASPPETISPATVLSFVKSHSLAVEATITARNFIPQAAFVEIAVNEDLQVIFETFGDSRKAHNIRRHPHIAFVIGGWKDGRTVQYEGIAEELRADDDAGARQTYFDRFPERRARESWPGITYFRASPTWLRYSDFRGTSPIVVEYSDEALRRLIEER